MRRLIDKGLERQIMLSSDLLYERGEVELNPDTFGRYGYSCLTERFLPELRELGIAESAIESMARGNAHRLMDVQGGSQ